MNPKNIILKKHYKLIKQGDTFKDLFVVKSGSIKEVYITEDGSSFITNFHFKNDVLGLDAIDLMYHSTSFLALEDTVVEKINFHEVLSNNVLSRRFLKKMAEVVNKNTIRKRVFNQNSECKIFFFLLEIFDRNTKNSDRINIKMTREDIASYLGLSEFTVSRVLSELQKENIIEIKQKSRVVKFIDINALKKEHPNI